MNECENEHVQNISNCEGRKEIELCDSWYKKIFLGTYTDVNQKAS